MYLQKGETDSKGSKFWYFVLCRVSVNVIRLLQGRICLTLQRLLVSLLILVLLNNPVSMWIGREDDHERRVKDQKGGGRGLFKTVSLLEGLRKTGKASPHIATFPVELCALRMSHPASCHSIFWAISSAVRVCTWSLGDTQPFSWQTCDRLQARLILPPASLGSLLGLFLDPEGDFFLRNVGLSPDYIPLHPEDHVFSEET
jgi:hypothetical protein